jgi:hypothetical protein
LNPGKHLLEIKMSSSFGKEPIPSRLRAPSKKRERNLPQNKIIEGQFNSISVINKPKHILYIPSIANIINTIFIGMLGGGTLLHLQWFSQCINYLMPEFTPSTALFHSGSRVILKIIIALKY